MLSDLWDLPRSEITPMSLALKGRFLTTELPEKHRTEVDFEKGGDLLEVHCLLVLGFKNLTFYQKTEL